jgi:hypothetical protein
VGPRRQPRTFRRRDTSRPPRCRPSRDRRATPGRGQAGERGYGCHEAGERVGDRIAGEHRAVGVARDAATRHSCVIAERDAHRPGAAAVAGDPHPHLRDDVRSHRRPRNTERLEGAGAARLDDHVGLAEQLAQVRDAARIA